MLAVVVTVSCVATDLYAGRKIGNLRPWALFSFGPSLGHLNRRVPSHYVSLFIT